jgi:hypothetical protein
MPRAKPIHIYLKPGIEDDELLMSVWEECKLRDRPQDVFRRLLKAGLRSMVENGEMPRSIEDALGLETKVLGGRQRPVPAIRAPEKPAAPVAEAPRPAVSTAIAPPATQSQAPAPAQVAAPALKEAPPQSKLGNLM